MNDTGLNNLWRSPPIYKEKLSDIKKYEIYNVTNYEAMGLLEFMSLYNNYSCYQMFGNCPQIITPINIMPTKYEKAIAPALNSDEWTCKVSGGRI